ncbi:unnamed protein product [Acanthoscelides obtectus]|uniref:Elongation factor 1-delta n=1 Tax=Acanthoscelides obtectus TaxID=200917 RepID=A0A9P0P370_ACAOB|nr:unnamed protein product [Acanthoscelides obtectus]CAK1629069.1 Elongation factor 1-delta [Acanthoscelides obtectus]
MATTVQTNDIWLTKKIYDDAERIYYENLSKDASPNASSDDLKSLKQQLAKLFEEQARVSERLLYIETMLKHGIPNQAGTTSLCKPEAKSAPKEEPMEEDDVDLFASDSDEDEAAAKVREERLAAYNAKKSKKPALIAKSNVILDIKPWDDETDMKKMEECVRKIEADGLLWGAHKLVPLAYGIHKLQISCVVEDDKVSIDWLTEQLQALEDYVQSVDIAAFNKI